MAEKTSNHEVKIPLFLESDTFDMLSKADPKTFFFIGDPSHGRSRWSPSAVDYFGLSGEILEPMTEWDELVHPNDYEKYIADMTNVINGVTPFHNSTYRIRNAKGEYVWINCHGYMTYGENKRPLKFVGMAQLLGTINMRDSVTGLWTEYRFRADLDGMLERGEDGGIMAIDIEYFKRVNLEHGYLVGDRVLEEGANKILAAMEDRDAYVYRLSGAQYAILLTGAKEKDFVELKDILDKIFENISVQGAEYTFSCHYAVAFFPKNGQYVNEIDANLSAAMSYARQTSSNQIVFYSDAIFEERAKIQKLKEELTVCVDEGCRGFRIVLQPVMDPKTGKLASAEALMRWTSERFPRVGPMDFVPILESTGYIHDVGKFVLDQALQTLAKWRDEKGEMVLPHINVNFSYIQFTDTSLKDHVVERLDHYGLPHECLVAELTESCRTDYTDEFGGHLQNFKDAGITLALDDFGTGYASLDLLRDMPADIVKLDHTMIRTIQDREKDRALIEFIISYCNKINLAVCAEGVETKEILDMVTEAGARFIQGYYYDRPLEIDEFYEKYIANA